MALGDLNEPYDLIVIGRGSAAAYYLESVPRRYRSLKDEEPLPLTILVIGEDDPWAGARGYQQGTYGQNINQASQVLAHRQGDTAPVSQGPQDRVDWAEQNKKILKTVANVVVKATVTYVGKVAKVNLTDREKFKVLTSQKEEYYGCKIVIAAGAGIEADGGHEDYHAMPPEVKSANLPGEQVMNLDRFMKIGKDKHSGKKVAILGPKAGTDAVMQAGTLGYPAANVYWLMRNQVQTGGFANVYPGENESEKKKISTIVSQSSQRILAYQDKSLKLAQSGNKVRVTCTPVASSLIKEANFEVDFFVYSIGQSVGNILTAPPQEDDPHKKARTFLDTKLQAELEPIYDINQRLGDKDKGDKHESAPWQHVCGVQIGGTTSESGLMIIGATAFQVAADVNHNFLQYEYRQLLDVLCTRPGFCERAREQYPELMAEWSLSEMRRLSPTQCDTKEKAFLLAWRTHLDEYMGNWVILDLIRIGNATGQVDEQVKVGKHLCYLFKQRCLAAEYLYDEKRELKVEMKVQAMLKPTNSLPEALQDCLLLAAVQANVSAINAPTPAHLQKKTKVDTEEWHANFLENKTELRAYIAAHYPNIAEDKAKGFIEDIASRRKLKGNMGFDKGEIIAFEKQLELLNTVASPSSSWWPFG